MTTNNEYFNWHQKSALVGAIDDKHADVMERHLMLPVGSVTTIQDMYSDILRRIETSNTEGSLKFPTTRKVIYEDSSASEDMFVGIKKDFIVDTVPKQSSDSSLDSLLKYQSEVNNCVFNSAREIFTLQNLKKIASYSGQDPSLKLPCGQSGDFSFAATKRSLGTFGRIPNPPKKSYVSPVRSKSTPVQEVPCDNEIDTTEIDTLLAHPALKNVDPKMVEMINNEIIHTFKYVDWNEIAGLNYAKSIIKEAVVYPMMRPDIFTGLRRPPRGILLFGPPGTGKTLIGKCIASQSSATFFSISSASLTSKWMGEGEKMVRALFAVARARQPSVIFIDEVDSLLSQRSETENEGTRRLKTEFLIRLDGACTTDDDRVLIVGATNRPQELDEAVRRRFVKRLYVPLPELDARVVILSNLLKTVGNNLDGNDLNEIGQLADGYSGADMDSLCREASMEPLRSLPFDLLMAYNKDSLRPVKKADFQKALEKIRPSVSQKDLDQYVEWNKTYGSSS